ncbi:MAG: outer membrane protein [Elusimicrobiota bacterium]
MKMLGRLSLFVVFVSFFASSSQAAVGGANQISIRAGGAFPTSANDFSDSAKAGIAGGVQYLRHISDRLGVGIQSDYFSFSGEDRSIVLANGNLNAKSDSTAWTAELVGRYSFRVDRKMRPYLSAGVGITRFAQETKGRPKNGTTWSDTGTREERVVADDSSTGYAVSGGIGVEFSISERLLAAVEGNWHVFGVDNDEFGTDAINVPSAFLRLGYRF